MIRSISLVLMLLLIPQNSYAFLGLNNDAENAVASISSHPDVYWVDIEFDGDKSFKKQAGNGYVLLKFDNKMNFSAPAIPSKARDAIKRISFDASGDLKVKIEFGNDYFYYISDRGKRLSVEIRKKIASKKEEKKTEDKKEIEAKKTEEKKELEARKTQEKKKKEAEEKKLAEKKSEEKKKQLEQKKKEEKKPEPEKPKPKPEPEVQTPIEETPQEAQKIELPEEPLNLQTAEIAPQFKEAKITYARQEDIEQLRFDFPKMPAAAVFERFGYLWIAFDTAANPKFPAIGSSEILAPVQKVKSDFMVYKLPLRKRAEINVRIIGDSWILEAGGTAEIQKRIRVIADGDQWVINAKHAGRAIKVFDDFTEDGLIIFPVTDLAQVGTEQTNSDFTMGKTFEGFVLRPISDLSGAVTFEADSIKIKKSAGAIDENQKRVAQAANLLPIYPFQKWKQLSGNAFRNAESSSAQAGKLENAYFLFGQGLYAEANIRLKGFDYMVPNFLRSAGNYLSGHYNEAALGFDATRLESGYDTNELLMWKIAANQMLARHNPAGAVMPADDNFILPKNLQNYPDDIAAKVLLPIAESYTNANDFKRANEVLAAMPKAAAPALLNYANYVQGKSFSAENKKARAYELWQKVVSLNTDRQSRAKASYELIMADLEAQKITPEVAAAKLDKLLIVWRGDKFERDLLLKLGALYAQQKQYLKALRLYKQIITKFYDFPDSASVTESMRGFFMKSLSGETDNKDRIFADLTTYYEFKELLPVGDDGDKITMNLADKLARYDLFEDAVKLLENQILSIQDNIKKAEFSTRVAILYFINHKPEKALDTLKISDAYGIPNYLKDERTIIATRSLIAMGDYDAALIAAAGLSEQEKNQTKADIYWKQSKWNELIDAYKNIPNKTQEDVLKLAIANSVLDNKTNLKLMRGQYGDMMNKGKYAQSFDFVTNTENINYRDLAGSLQIDATADLIKKFREKIKTDGLAGLTK